MTAAQRVLDKAFAYGEAKRHHEANLAHLDNQNLEWIESCQALRMLSFELHVAACNLFDERKLCLDQQT